MESNKPNTEATPAVTAPTVASVAAPAAVAAPVVAAKPVAVAKAEPKASAKRTPKASARPALKSATQPVAKPEGKAVAKPATKTAVKPSVAAAPKKASAPVTKAVTKPVTKSAAKPAPKATADKQAKEKKIKMVRDSISIPKDEYQVLGEMKTRAGKLGVEVKKTELIRAGIKLLASDEVDPTDELDDDGALQMQDGGCGAPRADGLSPLITAAASCGWEASQRVAEAVVGRVADGLAAQLFDPQAAAACLVGGDSRKKEVRAAAQNLLRLHRASLTPYGETAPSPPALVVEAIPSLG